MSQKSISDVGQFCTGCSACALVCPLSAIKIRESQQGFFQAFIDEGKCVRCGLCRAVCQRTLAYDQDRMLVDGQCYAARSTDDETVLSCTSGGIAYELAKMGIKDGDTVVGAKFIVETNRVTHVQALSEAALQQIKGSKYLQSDVWQTFQALIRQAKDNPDAKCMAFGTPCQIYGLDRVLEQYGIRDRFLLIDLLCHGVPSYALWDQYIDEIRLKMHASCVKSVLFRDKRIGWHNFVMKIETDHGAYVQPSEGDLFYRAFFDNTFLSKACMNCSTRMCISGADIRLGDMWGERYQGEEKGISAVIVLTEKGQKAFQRLAVDVLGRVDVRECLRAQSVVPYTTVQIQDRAINELRKGTPIRRIMRGYRRQFPVTRRMQLLMKEASALLPDSLRAKIRTIYRRRDSIV